MRYFNFLEIRWNSNTNDLISYKINNKTYFALISIINSNSMLLKDVSEWTPKYALYDEDINFWRVRDVYIYKNIENFLKDRTKNNVVIDKLIKIAYNKIINSTPWEKTKYDKFISILFKYYI